MSSFTTIPMWKAHARPGIYLMTASRSSTVRHSTHGTMHTQGRIIVLALMQPTGVSSFLASCSVSSRVQTSFRRQSLMLRRARRRSSGTPRESRNRHCSVKVPNSMALLSFEGSNGHGTAVRIEGASHVLWQQPRRRRSCSSENLRQILAQIRQ